MIGHSRLMEYANNIVVTAISHGYPRINASSGPTDQNKQYRDEIVNLFNSAFETLKTLDLKEEP